MNIMCGIAGEYIFGKDIVDIDKLRSVNEKLKARGPDHSEIYHGGHFALAHSQLKLSDEPTPFTQPFLDEELKLVVSFNGVIHNYQELYKQLVQMGYKFKSIGDTEVIIKAYHAWGVDCAKYFNGMFAVAIGELETGNLVVMRDRFGIKPLFYSLNNKGFKFASSLEAMLMYNDIDKSISPEALKYYMDGKPIPEPLSIISGILKFPSATAMTILPDGKIKQKNYQDFNDVIANPVKLTRKEWLEKATKTITDSVNSVINVSAVRSGLMLSPGAGSAIVTALSAQNLNYGLEAFSVHHENDDKENKIHSELLAEQNGVLNNKIFVSKKNITESLENYIKAMSEPVTGIKPFIWHMISKQISSSMKVAISGHGGNEIFSSNNSLIKFINQSSLLHLDNQSMSCSVEAHTPFTDNRIIELALAMPAEFKTENGEFLLDLYNKIVPGSKLYVNSDFNYTSLKHINSDMLDILKERINIPKLKQPSIELNDIKEELSPSYIWKTGILQLWHEYVVK